MLDLALMIAEYLMGKKRRAGGRGPSPVEKHRNTEVDPVVVECPHCGNLGVCTHFQIEESPASQNWQGVNEIYVCAGCKLVLEAEHFENDGTGVLRAKRWTCGKCQTQNAAPLFTCANCHAWRS